MCNNDWLRYKSLGQLQNKMIMKAYSFFKKGIFVLVALLAFVSCSDDDNASVLSSRAMLNQELVASNYSFIWNGETSPRKDDVKAKFEAIDGDSTKLKMTILGVMPSSDETIQLVVDVYPQTDEIQYQGKVENPNYDMSVSGVYFPSKSNAGHYFKLKIVYNVVNTDFVDKSYQFNFNQGCTVVPRSNGGKLVIDDTEYSKIDVAEHVLSEITKLYASTDSVLALNFAKDGSLSLDILNIVKGQMVTTNWITPKYWFSTSDKALVFEFTKEQATAFATKFLDKKNSMENLFTKYDGTDKYILKVRYYTMNGKLSLELISPYMENAMSIFATGRGSKLGSALQKQINALATELKESATKWQIQFVSE